MSNPFRRPSTRRAILQFCFGIGAPAISRARACRRLPLSPARTSAQRHCPAISVDQALSLFAPPQGHPRPRQPGDVVRAITRPFPVAVLLTCPAALRLSSGRQSSASGGVSSGFYRISSLAYLRHYGMERYARTGASRAERAAVSSRRQFTEPSCEMQSDVRVRGRSRSISVGRLSQCVDAEQHEPPSVSSDQPRSLEFAQACVHRLSRRANERRQLFLTEGEVDH